jgi:caa(3)-type oxidase subunit IV
MSATYHVNYKKIYITLLVLLAISIAGPMLEIPWLTLITAFGIAIVKATLVVNNFMHLKWERRIMKWVLLSSVVIVGLFWAAVEQDVKSHEGRNWVNNSARAAIARGIPAPGEHGPGGEAKGEHGVPAGGDSAAGHDSAKAPAAPAPAAAGFNAQQTYQAVCSSCHGQTGGGDGPAGLSLNPRPANFASGAFWVGKTDEQIVRAIRGGGAAVGKSPLMPAWGALYNEAQALELARYIRSFSR